MQDIERNLEPTALKFIGDKDTVYENAVTSWGFMMMENGVRLINQHESCVLITGEIHEWEFVECVHDAHRLGFRKALIVVGHVASEEGGMEHFCSDLQKQLPSRSILYIRTRDLFQG